MGPGKAKIFLGKVIQVAWVVLVGVWDIRWKGKVDMNLGMGELVSAEQESIAAEIRKSIRKLIRGCEALDTDLAFEIFYDSPEFLMIGTDGTHSDYNVYLDSNIGYLKTCTRFKLATFKEEIRVLDHQTAIFSWAYRAEATLKTGEIDIVDKAGATFVFRKLGGEWKVVYYHESSVPPTRITKVQ